MERGGAPRRRALKALDGARRRLRGWRGARRWDDGLLSSSIELNRSRKLALSSFLGCAVSPSWKAKRPRRSFSTARPKTRGWGRGWTTARFGPSAEIRVGEGGDLQWIPFRRQRVALSAFSELAPAVILLDSEPSAVHPSQSSSNTRGTLVRFGQTTETYPVRDLREGTR